LIYGFLTTQMQTFYSGVIEGFYGRPWQPDQRLQLLGRLRDWGLNSFMYAPKDDRKHRAFWRALYSDSEAENLRKLVSACTERKIQLIYAIAPGLDIRYSSDADAAALHAKLAQVHKMGGENAASV
jgi:protein O-GlcNAcase / histone acetyltransferase